MRPTLKVNTMNLKAPKAVLLGTSALICLALAAPVMAEDFVITGSDNSTNGTGTTNGTAGAIAADVIDGSETVTAAYSGTEILVGVNAQRSKPINETVSVITGVNASLSNEKIGAYSESKCFAWDARRMT